MKISIFPPKKIDVIIYDYQHSKFAKFILPKNIDYQILHTRLEKINLFVLFKTLFKFKLKLKYYFQTYIDLCNPKLMITFCDNDLRFYQLNRKNLKKISLQNGRRSQVLDMFGFSADRFKDSLTCDYICVHNNNVGNLYKEKIKTKILAVGSFLSNNININKIKKNYLVYISCFKPVYLKDEIFHENFKFSFLMQQDIKILINLKKFLQKNNEKLKILAKYGDENFLQEKKFYLKIFGNKNIEIIRNQGHQNSFKITDQSKLVIGNDSTMAFECFARGSKVLFVSRFSINKKIFRSKIFFWPDVEVNEGLFWINNGNYFKIEKKIKKLLDLNNAEWFGINFQYKKKIMFFDKNNKIIKNKIKNLLNY